MKGLMLFHDNMEDVEALATKALLKRANIEVETVSVSSKKEVKMSYGTKVKADYLLEEVKLDDFEFLIIPGGSYVNLVIKEDVKIKSLISSFHKNDKSLFAICAAPKFLGELGLLKGKNYTIFPTLDEDAFLANLKKEEKVVRDGNIITGRSVGALFDFVSEIINFLKGEEAKKDFLNKIYY